MCIQEYVSLCIAMLGFFTAVMGVYQAKLQVDQHSQKRGKRRRRRR